MSKIHLLIGNIGSGKSRMARRLSLNGAVVVNMDSIVSMTHGGRYNAYDKDVGVLYRHVEEEFIQIAIEHGHDVVIDRTNMDLRSRERYIDIAVGRGVEIIAYDFGQGSGDELQRRLSDPRGIPNQQWFDVWHDKREAYVMPTLDEGFSTIWTPPSRHKFHVFDFDGTLVEHDFPKIGGLIPSSVDLLKSLWRSSSNVIIIWTCRSGDHLNEMRKFLHDEKIPFDFINENPMFPVGSPKIYGDVYYDDRAVSMPLLSEEG